MILACPECRTRYQTDALNFPPAGRKVRCAKCGHIWHQQAPQREVELAPGQETSASANGCSSCRSVGRFRQQTRHPFSGRKAARGAHGRRSLASVAGWVRTHRNDSCCRMDGIALPPGNRVAVAPIVVALRTDWRRSQRKGNRHCRPGFSPRIRNTVSRCWPSRSSGQYVLARGGRATRSGWRSSIVTKRELCHWTISPSQPTLRPGQSVKFFTQLSSPPGRAPPRDAFCGEPGMNDQPNLPVLFSQIQISTRVAGARR